VRFPVRERLLLDEVAEISSAHDFHREVAVAGLHQATVVDLDRAGVLELLHREVLAPK